MSTIAIRRALEKHLDTMPDLPAIAWENTNFMPSANEPYIEPILFFVEPDDIGFRNSPFIQRGYLQLNLRYPTNEGTVTAQLKAEQLRDYFFRGLTLVEQDIPVNIERTPEITNGSIIDDRFVIRMFIRFYATIDPLMNDFVPLD